MRQMRKDLSLSQQELALMLNVSRSAIALYEKGLRPLPAKAGKIWAEMILLWQRQQRLTEPPRHLERNLLIAQQQQSLSLLNLHLQRAAARSISITQQLTGMEQQYRCQVRKLHFIKGVMQEAKQGSREMELLQNREQQALLTLAGCCPQRRQLLAFKLQVLRSQQKAALAGKVIVQQQG